MKRHLFAYGTLLVPEIWDLVVGKTCRNEPAILHGYDIFRVEGGDFPGAVISDDENATVPGRVFHDLDADAIARLDAYEDTFYERLEVTVQQSKDDSQIFCDTYAVPISSSLGILSDERWTIDWFQENAQKDYIRRLRAFL